MNIIRVGARVMCAGEGGDVFTVVALCGSVAALIRPDGRFHGNEPIEKLTATKDTEHGTHEDIGR